MNIELPNLPPPQAALKKPLRKRPLVKPSDTDCRRCRTTYPFTAEYFPRRRAARWGLATVCLSCAREVRAEWSAKRRVEAATSNATP